MIQDDAQSIGSSHESAWSEAEDEQYDFQAFHDDQSFGSLDEMLRHEMDNHHFDLARLRQEFHLDLYGSIRLVNYLRKAKATERQVRQDIEKIKTDESLLQPVLENDAVLFHLVDDGSDDEMHGGADGEWKTKFEALQSQFNLLQQSVRASIDARPATHGDDKPDNDSYYFDSYGYNDIHETMLKDAVRTDAYRDAVYDNKDIFKDKIVLDVGCGTGILSMFCAKAGAKHVYAIDNSNIIDKARSNAYENGLDERITFIKGKVEDIKLPVTEVDIIISEWMGYALLYESMLDSVLSARDRFLSSTGLMMPSQTTMIVAGVSDKDYFDDRVNFWSDIYGFKMGAMKDGIFDDILIDTLKESSLGTNAVVFESLDLHKVDVQDLVFKSSFELRTLPGHESIVAFQIWFDTFFTRSRSGSADVQKPIHGSAKIADGNAFSTGPYGTPTHWKQAVLLIDGDIKLSHGEVLQGEIEYRKGKNNPRFLEIVIDWHIVTEDGHTRPSSSRSQVWHLA